MKNKPYVISGPKASGKTFLIRTLTGNNYTPPIFGCNIKNLKSYLLKIHNSNTEYRFLVIEEISDTNIRSITDYVNKLFAIPPVLIFITNSPFYNSNKDFIVFRTTSTI